MKAAELGVWMKQCEALNPNAWMRVIDAGNAAPQTVARELDGCFVTRGMLQKIIVGAQHAAMELQIIVETHRPSGFIDGKVQARLS